MADKNIEYLRKYGPTLGEHLPGQRKPKQRAQGVRVFRLAGARGETVNADRLRAIYHLDSHDSRAVVGAFADAHPKLVDAKSKEGFVRIISRRGTAWKEAACIVSDELNLESHTDGGGVFDADAEHICPACRMDIDTKLPTHLTGDFEAT